MNAYVITLSKLTGKYSMFTTMNNIMVNNA